MNKVFSRASLAVAAGFVAVAAGGFISGYAYGTHSKPAVTMPPIAPGARSYRGGYMRGNRVVGTVSSLSGTAMTIKTASGAMVNVSLAGAPTIVDSSGNSLTASSIHNGDTVLVTGTRHSDGSITAVRVRDNTSTGSNSSAGGA